MIYIVWEACLDVSKTASYQETQKVSQFMRELEKNAIKLISAFQIRIQVVYIRKICKFRNHDWESSQFIWEFPPLIWNAAFEFLSWFPFIPLHDAERERERDYAF